MCDPGKNTGSGEGRGPSDAKLRKKIGGYATDKEKRAHDKGYGKRATPRETKRYWEGLFTRLPAPTQLALLRLALRARGARAS